MWQVCPHCRKKQGGISTHTSRVGCDVSEILTASIFKSHFYSHIPCGMWPCVRQARVISAQFLLTHPVWDVTKKSWRTSGSLTFLLTHPVWDVTNRKRKLTNQLKFLLTHPVWDVTHTSRVGCDSQLKNLRAVVANFYSHIPCGMWRFAGFACWRWENFYSHIPCGMWPPYA